MVTFSLNFTHWIFGMLIEELQPLGFCYSLYHASKGYFFSKFRLNLLSFTKSSLKYLLKTFLNFGWFEPHLLIKKLLIKNNECIHIFRDGNGKDGFYVGEAFYPKSPPPFNLTVMKGTKNIIISKNFSNFLTTNSVATDFFHWTKVCTLQCCEKDWIFRMLMLPSVFR